MKNAGSITLFVTACFCLFFHRVWGGELLLAADPLMYSLPLRTAAWNMIQQGALPLWTPLILSGYPLLSMAQLGLAYPLTWGYLLFPNYVAEQIYVLAPFLLAPLFTYTWMREMGRSRIAGLLAGLSFGYGGMMASLLSNGMMPNAVMWLPLLLSALKRAQRQSSLSCLLGATTACTMSLFTGIGQGFLFAILLAFAWSLFQTIPIVNDAQRGIRQRFAPLAILVGAIAASSGIAAFQLLETSQAAHQSIRASLSYETFTEMSFTPLLVWKSFIAPLFHHERWIEVTTFVSLPVALLALLAIVMAVDKRTGMNHKAEVLFWAATAVVAFILMLGGNTPLFRLLYHIPIINQFRAPSRHAFEWSFAISVLAAYGWDALKASWPLNKETGLLPNYRLVRMRPVASAALLICTGIVGVAWWLAMADNPAQALLFGTGSVETAYVIWKLAFALLLIAGSLLALNVHSAKWQAGLLLSAMILVCLVEPYILMSRWWGKFPVSMNRPSAVSPVTRFLLNYSPTQNRVYTRVHGGVEQFTSTPRLDPPNLTALHGLHNIAGHEPLMLERYSRALGGAGRDAVHPGYAGAPDDTLFEARSQVLNILNAKFVAAFTDLHDLPDTLIERDGAQFSERDFSDQAQAGESFTLHCGPDEGDTLNLVSTLANAAGIEQGATIAKALVHTTGNRVIERELRAGIDSAEWAHERADVRATVKHSLAPIFDCRPGDNGNNFPACRYWSRISLGQTLHVKNIEVIKFVDMRVWKATLSDSRIQRSIPLSPKMEVDRQSWRNGKRWQPVYDEQGALILQNQDALPRAWLVAQAEEVTETEALQKIRGEANQLFNPLHTALLEIPPGENLPALPGGVLPPEATVRNLIYKPNGLEIETFADRPTLLVVSEMNYPGWVATIDGSPAAIYTANYLIQAVALPAGHHLVKMHYTAPAGARGLVISGVSLLVFAGIMLLAKLKNSGIYAAHEKRDGQSAIRNPQSPIEGLELEGDASVDPAFKHVSPIEPVQRTGRRERP